MKPDLGAAARLLLSTALLLLLISPALAQVDPQARQYALQLYPYYQQAVQSGNWTAFAQGCAMDPVLTRKMFITTLQYCDEQAAADPVGSREAYGFAKAMANEIGKQFGDQGPLAVIAAIESGRPRTEQAQMLVAYATTVYSLPTPSSGGQGYVAYDPATQQYGQFEFLPDNWTAFDRDGCLGMFGAFSKVQLTVAFACLDQGLIQSELASAEVERISKFVAATGNDSGKQSLLAFFQTGLDAFQIATLVEVGLIEEAKGRLPGLVQRPENKNYRAAVLLSFARVAIARGRHEEAKDYLRQARALTEKFVPPALEYALLTAEYQVRRQSGYQPDNEQRIRDFRAVWNKAFAGYQPFQRVQADAYWYYGRKATRYWLEEFDPDAQPTRDIHLWLHQELASWMQSAKNLDGWAKSAPLDLQFNPEHLGNFITAMFAVIDQTVAVVEAEPVDSSLRQSTQSFQAALELATIVSEESKDGAPSFTLTESGLYCEIKGRLKMLEAEQPARPTQERVELVGQAVALMVKSQGPDVTLSSLIRAGKLLQDLGRSDLAVQRWKEALKLADSLSYTEQSIEAAALLAETFSQQKNWAEAALYADQASQKLQENVVVVANDKRASKQLAQTADQMTEVSVKAAIQTEDPEKALAALVRGKEAQSATAQVRGEMKGGVEVTAVQQQQKDVAALSVQVERLGSLPPSKARDELLRKTQALLADTKADFLLKVRGLRQKYPDLYSQALKFDPLDLPDIQKMLPAEAAVIQYFPTADGLYIFLVTRDTFRLRLEPVSEKELGESVTSFVRAIRRAHPGDSGLMEQSQSLYSHLIEPCQADIESKSVLVLIPTGRLNILPFSCLTTPQGVSLVENKLVLELAKPTDFMRISMNPPKKIQTVVAFANATGDLPAAGKEGDQIAALFTDSRLFKGKEATKKNFFDFGAGADVLHLATHGESNSDNSLTNYLAMNGDERIAQEEIFALALDETSIVTLSACNTAVGDNLDSKFVASLAEAFWLGGSQSVIASLWAVNDESTGLLMTEFYSGLREGKGKALALKDAQLKVKNTPGFEAPYYWAGFILFGDWR